eukprot:364838-Chlamydomonas_euryale.AAC.6
MQQQPHTRAGASISYMGQPRRDSCCPNRHRRSSPPHLFGHEASHARPTPSPRCRLSCDH